MSFCRDCRFFKPFVENGSRGECVHPYSHGITRHYLDISCVFCRSTKWKGCLVAFPKGIAIAFVYLFDLFIAYLLFGKTLYKRTQGKETPDADR